jgi:hypothetical protein
MTTSDYLTQLQKDKEVLVTNLQDKGVDATSEETFTTLCPKVADIQTGGGDDFEITDAEYLFAYGARLDIEDILLSKAKKPKSIIFMYWQAPARDTFDISKIDISNCTSLFKVFDKSSKSSSDKYTYTFKLPKTGYSKITNLQNFINYRKFYGVLDLSVINTGDNLVNCYGMLANSECIGTIKLPITKVQNAGSIFDTLKIYTDETATTYGDLDVSNMDFSMCTAFSRAFYNANINNITGEIDMSSATNANDMFNSSYYINSINLKNLKTNLTISSMSNISAESIDYLLNNVQDVTSSPKTLTLGSTNLAKASEEAIANATSKGWTVN